MNINEIKNRLNSDEYSFLKTDKNLGRNIILLTVGGSHAYGTENENSDLDIRGCALNSKMQILTNQNFEQFTNVETDTTIYSFNKLISLLCSVNPNTIELLGNRPEHYFYVHPIGRQLIDNGEMFLSKRAVHSFGGYADQQLRRLENKSNRMAGQAQNEEHILKTIGHASYEFKRKYFDMPEDSVKLYIDRSDRDELEAEIFMDINLTHYPLRDYKDMISEMQSIVKSYNKIGCRNEKAVTHGKLGKHMMHLVRLYLMCFDILEKGKIVTYREAEHDLLMDIRNGKYLDDNKQPVPEFYEMLNGFEKRFDYAKNNTSLPDLPDYGRINEFVAEVNEKVVRNEF